MSAHTTAGVMVNEDLTCLHTDIEATLDKMAPVVADYAHSHYLPSYGATGGNAPGHLKQMLTGYEVMFPVIEGKALIRFAQDIYFAEFDGPQMRTYYIEDLFQLCFCRYLFILFIFACLDFLFNIFCNLLIHWF